MMNIGNALKEIRIRKNITQEELCRGHISTKHLSDIENNKKNPTIDKVETLATNLNVSISDIIEVYECLKNNKRSLRTPYIYGKNKIQSENNVTIHYNEDELDDAYKFVFWYSGFIGACLHDEHEVKYFCDGINKGTLVLNYNTVFRNQVINEDNLRNYFQSDEELSTFLEYMDYDDEIVKKKNGNVLFINESKSIRFVYSNHKQGIVYEDYIEYDIDDVYSIIADYNRLIDLEYSDEIYSE